MAGAVLLDRLIAQAGLAVRQVVGLAVIPNPSFHQLRLAALRQSLWDPAAARASFLLRVGMVQYPHSVLLLSSVQQVESVEVPRAASQHLALTFLSLAVGEALALVGTLSIKQEDKVGSVLDITPLRL